jgi:hypothetical protein
VPLRERVYTHTVSVGEARCGDRCKVVCRCEAADGRIRKVGVRRNWGETRYLASVELRSFGLMGGRYVCKGDDDMWFWEGLIGDLEGEKGSAVGDWWPER